MTDLRGDDSHIYGQKWSVDWNHNLRWRFWMGYCQVTSLIITKLMKFRDIWSNSEAQRAGIRVGDAIQAVVSWNRLNHIRIGSSYFMSEECSR